MKRWHWPLSATSGAASRPAAAPDQPLFTSAKAHTSAEGAKNGYIFLVAAVVPFVLAIILAHMLLTSHGGMNSFGCPRRWWRGLEQNRQSERISCRV
jgi:hypothetical protein